MLMEAAPRAEAQAPRPTVSFGAAMNTWMSDTNGLIAPDRVRLAFVPEGDLNMVLGIVDQAGNIVGRHDYAPEVDRFGSVFAVARLKQSGSQTQLTEPGIYSLVWVIDGQPATRLPVRLRQTGAGDDPFNPQKTFAFDGYWRTHAYWTMHKTGNDPPTPKLHYWVGGLDVPEGRRSDMFFAQLIKDGQVVAHSKRTQGHLPPGRWTQNNLLLFHPHEKKDTPNARVWSQADLLTDGRYELRFTRQSDNQMIRSYDYTVAEGKLVPLAESALDYEPRVDHVLPRVQRKGATTVEMIEAFWIKDGGPGGAEAQ